MFFFHLLFLFVCFCHFPLDFHANTCLFHYPDRIFKKTLKTTTTTTTTTHTHTHTHTHTYIYNIYIFTHTNISNCEERSTETISILKDFCHQRKTIILRNCVIWENFSLVSVNFQMLVYKFILCLKVRNSHLFVVISAFVVRLLQSIFK